MKASSWPILAAIAIVGCNQSPFPDIDLERMIRQRKFLSYSASDYFKDGRAMRSPRARSSAPRSSSRRCVLFTRT